MGDSWEDEDFEVPTLPAAALTKDNWDEEEDLVEVDKKIVVTPLTPAQIEAARVKAAEADAALAAKIKLAQLANETPAERKLREKKQVEDADNALTGELFDSLNVGKSTGVSSSSKGMGSIVLKTKQDHASFGTTTAAKLSESTTFNVGAFFKNVVKVLDRPDITAETLDDILADINKYKATKAAAAKTVVPQKSKKDIKSAAKRHNDVFGGSDYVDKYEASYGGIEDDFM
jgi:hypothetical protein